MKIDDAENYFLNFETDLPSEAGAVPLGMYFAWLADNRLLNADQAAAVARCRSAGSPSSAEVFLTVCDGKLMASDLSPEGQAFTQHYYARHYLHDYATCFNVDGNSVDALCGVPDTPAQRERLAKGLALRHQQWQKARKAPASAATAPTPTPAAPTTTAQPTQPTLPPSLEAVMAGLQEQCIPLLERDGFVLTNSRYDGLIFRRTVGDVEQQVWIMCTGDGGNTGRTVMANVLMHLGCQRLQAFWLPLLDPAYAQQPPAEMQKDFRWRPTITADAHNIVEDGSILGESLKRNQHLHNRWPTVIAETYVQHLRPVLDSASDTQGLAAIALGRRRTAPVYGDTGVPSIELLNRIVLFAAYPPAGTTQPLLQGPQATRFKADLLEPVRSDSAVGTFPRRADLDRLLDIVMQPGFAENARQQLARTQA